MLVLSTVPYTISSHSLLEAMPAENRGNKVPRHLKSNEFTESTKHDLPHPTTNKSLVRTISGSCRRAFQSVSNRCRNAVHFRNRAPYTSRTPILPAADLECSEHTMSSNVVSTSRPPQLVAAVNNSDRAVTATTRVLTHSPTPAALTPTDPKNTKSSAEVSIQSLAKPPQPNQASYMSISPSTAPHAQRENIFITNALVAVYGGGPGIELGGLRHAVIMYDSGCEYNLISTNYVETLRKPKDATLKRTFAMSITGQPFEDVGEVDIRWRDDNITRFRFLDATCRIVESDFFDVIIGRRTILDEKLFVPNPDIAGPLLTSVPQVPGKKHPHDSMID
jgi:hypothetical protein